MASQMSLSFSESVQASIILRHQQAKLLDEKGTSSTKDGKEEEEASSKERVPFYIQCMMVVVFFGMDMSLTFSLIYNILFLQFLGVPTSLLSLGGVISGSTCIIFIPITAWLSERGSNPLRRKLQMLMIDFSFFVLGYTCLIICSASKLYYVHDGAEQENATLRNNAMLFNTTHVSYHSTIKNSTDPLVAWGGDNLPKSHINFSTVEVGNNPDPTSSIFFLGLIGFALTDIGYDSCMSVWRAYLLECSPPAIHTRLLLLATVFSSVGGAAVSVMGTIDFPEILASAFGVDGTAATILLFSCIIFFIVTCTLMCSLVVSYLMHNRYIESNFKKDLQDGVLSSELKADDQKSSSGPLWKSSWSSLTGLREPLLEKNKPENISYSSLSLTDADGSFSEQSPNVLGLDKPQYPKILSQWENPNQVIYEDKPYVVPTTSKFEDSDAKDDDIVDDDDNDNESLISREEQENFDTGVDISDSDCEEMGNDDQNAEGGLSAIMSAIGASFSMSLSIIPSSLMGDMQDHKDNIGKRDVKSKEMGTNVMKSKRLNILFLCVFLSMGANVADSVYSANAVTIGIYDGDPTSPPRTPGRERYAMGMRAAALGFVVNYTTFAVTSILLKRMIDYLGEKALYSIGQALFFLANIGIVVFKTEIFYYTGTAVFGLNRCCLFSIAYVLGHKFVQESFAHGGDPRNLKKKIGQVLAVIAFLMPSQYLLMSSLIGPMLEATGNVFVPLIIAGGCAAAAFVASCLLFVVRT